MSEDKFFENISGILKGYQANIDSQLTIVNGNLDDIKKQLEKMNGSLRTHEKEINELKTLEKLSVQKKIHDKEKQDIIDKQRLATCPQNQIIRTIQEDQLTSKTIKAFIVKTVVIAASIIGAIVTFFQLFVI